MTRNQFIAAADLSLEIEKIEIKVPEKYRDEIQYTFFSDKDVQLRFIIPLLKEFEILGYSEVNFAVRNDTDLNEEFNFRLLTINLEMLSKIEKHKTVYDFVNTLR